MKNPADEHPGFSHEANFRLLEAAWGLREHAARILGLASVNVAAGHLATVRHPVEHLDLPPAFNLVLCTPSAVTAQGVINTTLAPILKWVISTTQEAAQQGRNATKLEHVKIQEEVLRKEFALSEAGKSKSDELDTIRIRQLSGELEELKGQAARTRQKLRPSILTRCASTTRLLHPQRFSFDGAVANIGDQSHLNEWLQLGAHERGTLQRLFGTSWAGGIFHEEDPPCLCSLSEIIGMATDDMVTLLPRLETSLPAVRDHLVLVHGGTEAQPVKADSKPTDDWITCLDTILRDRLTGEVRRYHLSEEAGREFFFLYKTAAATPRFTQAPTLCLKFALLLHLMTASRADPSIPLLRVKQAMVLVQAVSDDQEYFTASPMVVAHSSPLEKLIAKIGEKGPVSWRELLRSSSSQKAAPLRKLLDEAIQQGRIIEEEGKYRVG